MSTNNKLKLKKIYLVDLLTKLDELSEDWKLRLKWMINQHYTSCAELGNGLYKFYKS